MEGIIYFTELVFIMICMACAERQMKFSWVEVKITMAASYVCESGVKIPCLVSTTYFSSPLPCPVASAGFVIAITVRRRIFGERIVLQASIYRIATHKLNLSISDNNLISIFYGMISMFFVKNQEALMVSIVAGRTQGRLFLAIRTSAVLHAGYSPPLLQVQSIAFAG